MLLKVNGVVRLTRDVELKFLPSGSALANLGLVCSKKYKSASGEQKEDTLFIDGKVFGKMGEVANQYLKKGSKIYINGDLNYESWTAQDGSTRSKHTVLIESFEMLDSKEQQITNQEQKNEPKPENRPPKVEHRIPEIDIDEDSIPF